MKKAQGDTPNGEAPISVGDLVIVVKPTICCGNARSIGNVLLVVDGPRASFMRCPRCGQTDRTTDEVTVDDGRAIERRRLKRIPPLGELDGVSEEQWTTTKWTEPA